MTDVAGAAPSGRGSPANLATGAFIASGAAVSLAVGFMPRAVKIIDETSGKVYEKLQGNSPNTTLVNGAIDTTGIVTFPADTGLNEPGSTVLIAAGTFALNDKIAWSIFG